MGQDLNITKNPSAEALGKLIFWGLQRRNSAISKTWKLSWIKQLCYAKEYQGFIIYDYLKWDCEERCKMTCLICEPKRPWRILDVVIHILMGKLKRMLLDAHCWFLWEIQELSCEELNLLTLKLIAAVLFKLFLVEQIQDWTKLKIHWN